MPLLLSVPDEGLDVAFHQLIALVQPFGFAKKEQREAQARTMFIPVAQAMAGANHVARTHRLEVGVGLSAVHAAPALWTAGSRRPVARVFVFDRPGEGIEILRRDDAAPARRMGVVLVPKQTRRRLRPVDRDRKFANVRQ